MLSRRPRRNKEQTAAAPSRWLSSSSRRKPRAPYGTGIKIFPRIDIITPRGAFAQQVDPAPTSSEPSASIEPSVVSSAHKTPKTAAPDRRMLQLQAWVEKTVPSLVQPFMDLLANSQNLQQINRAGPFCSCGPHVRKVDVTCIEFFSLHVQSVCGCALAENLVAGGYFPSSPVRPTFAIDLKMLSFMHELHVRSSPNITAWSSALEEFLSSQGFATSSTDCLRRKVASCLRWYRFLNATKDMLVDQFIHLASSPAVDVPVVSSGDGQVDENAGIDAPSDDDVASGEDNGEDESQWADDDGPSDVRASRYLQDCCALCFGGDVCSEPQLLTDVIVALDANFQQKRRRPGRGVQREPPFAHPNTCFLSAEEVKLAKDHVEECRPDRSTNSKPASNEDDRKEPGMKVPNSVLSGCHDSFTAADEKRRKASTTHFADTGLMALQCRHDTVLWMVNMTTPGERQFYAIALLLKLFSHLPENAHVGLLYDIACQLEQSCQKWELLGDLVNRMTFAVSRLPCGELADLDQRLVAGADSWDIPLDELVTARESLTTKLASLNASLAAKQNRLDLTGREELQKIASSRFFALKVNARALRDRILSKLQNRKFEMERLEKVIRGGGSSEQKLHSHVEVQLKKQEPQISNLIKRYNTMCTEMADMIRRHVAPPSSTCPPLIDRASVSTLDVDSPIWDDSYFDESLSGAPEWMANEDLRHGIRLWLDSERCSEEQDRLLAECSHLQEWSYRAWHEVSAARIAFSDNPGLSFQLERRADKLFTLICSWRSDLMSLPLPPTFDHALWGPSLVQLTKGVLDNLASSLGHLHEDNAEMSDEESDVGGADGQDEDVWHMLENLEVAELSEPSQEHGMDLEQLVAQGQVQQSPSKRARVLDNEDT
ncbi:hypothetical protein BKA70DRAFT_1425430 [Coprinopsis sp. MPI-PUGE-AT-0042]|nr:hypothetical protein BKA70DRAFT_1425430 [Coprinopsis sp. MPI-PUGE-AT-0042]